MKVKYAINVVSLMTMGRPRWPYRRGVGLAGMMFREAQALIDMALEVGYDGVQMLPIRGATGNESDILLYEGAWNAVPNLPHALWGKMGASDMPSNWKDWLVSPAPEVCDEVCDRWRKGDIQHITHDFSDPDHLVELNQNIPDVTPAMVDKICEEQGYRLVIDTHHLRYRHRNEDPNPLLVNDGWYPTVCRLAPYICAIHFNTTGEETDEDRSTINLILYHTSRHAEEAGVSELIVVAEYEPTPRTMLSHSACKAQAAAMLERMKEHTF